MECSQYAKGDKAEACAKNWGTNDNDVLTIDEGTANVLTIDEGTAVYPIFSIEKADGALFIDAAIGTTDIEFGGDGIVKGDGWSLNLKSVSEHMAMCEVLKTQKEVLNMQYMTIGGTLFVVIVCIITVKWIIPRLTISNIVKGFVRLLYWPFRRFGRVVCDAWKKETTVRG